MRVNENKHETLVSWEQQLPHFLKTNNLHLIQVLKIPNNALTHIVGYSY